LSNFKKSLELQMDVMRDCTLDLSAEEEQRYSTEVEVVTMRASWLRAIVAGDAEMLLTMIDEAKAGPAAVVTASLSLQDAGEAGSVTTSRDLKVLARGGPCLGFEKLAILDSLESLKSTFAACRTLADIRAAFTNIKEQKQMFVGLVASCKLAVGDLESAKAQHTRDIEKAEKDAEKAEQEKEKESRKQEKDKKHRVRRAIATGMSGQSQSNQKAWLFEREPQAGPDKVLVKTLGRSCAAKDLDAGVPFMVSGCNFWEDIKDFNVPALVEDFRKEFNKSSMKAGLIFRVCCLLCFVLGCWLCSPSNGTNNI
jgi:hypothetical protein